MEYLFPSEGDFSTLVEKAQRAKIPIHTPSTVREYILTGADGGSRLVLMPADELAIIVRYAESLMDELPTVVMSVPGVIYSRAWTVAASNLPLIDWVELDAKLSKSGHTAYSRAALAAKQQTETIGRELDEDFDPEVDS